MSAGPVHRSVVAGACAAALQTHVDRDGRRPRRRVSMWARSERHEAGSWDDFRTRSSRRWAARSPNGYEAARARRLYQEGLGATEADDLALALGFPMLVELGPDVGDPGAYARDRIHMFARSLVKDDVARLTRRGAVRLVPHVAAIAAAADTPSRLKRAARALLAAVAPG